MLLEKEQPKPKPKKKVPSNCYEVVITANHGDADHSEERTIRIPDSREDLLKMLLHDIDVTERYYSHDNFEESPFMRKWCEDGDDESIVNECREISFTDWPRDITADRQFPCTFYFGPDVYYYDEQGERLHVTVTYSDEEKATEEERLKGTWEKTKAAVIAEEKAERANKSEQRCAVCGQTQWSYGGPRKTCSSCGSELLYTQRLFDADGETITDNDNPYQSIEDLRTKILPELDKLRENDNSRYFQRWWFINRKVENHDKGLPEDA